MIGFLLASLALAAGQAGTSGIVRDSSGAPVAAATVSIRTASGRVAISLTDTDGTFRFVVAEPFEITIRAKGFGEYRRRVDPVSADSPLLIQLELARLQEQVTVTVNGVEQSVRDVAATISILDRQTIRLSPAATADDVLRQVPAFSLFRRSDSLASHPTAQGVSLRGVGPSGVSRTLVLQDGIPMNDPFGGWVSWTRVPLQGLERIEVVEGIAGNLYGNSSLGGVINLIASPTRPRTLNVETRYGTQRTPSVRFSAGVVPGRVSTTLHGSFFRTRGYPAVARAERGPIDTRVSARFADLAARIEFAPRAGVALTFRAEHFRERRDNGKISSFDGSAEANSTRWTAISGRVRSAAAGGSIDAAVFADIVQFRSNFLAVPAAVPPRSVGRMTLAQRVPSQSVGGRVEWSRPALARQFVSVGVDGRHVNGDSEEAVLDSLSGQTVIFTRVSGGSQRIGGAFVQDVITLRNNLALTLAGRLDHWRNAPNETPTLPSRSDTVFSPRVAAIYHPHHRVDTWAAVGSAFRAPTLNELYRQFRVGSVLTLANDQLGPERLRGGEIGARLRPTAHTRFRAVLFANGLRNAVGNVTIAQAGSAVTQQRQNVGRTMVRGLEVDGEVRATQSLRARAAVIYTAASVSEFDANPALVGKRLPQVPAWRGSFELSYDHADRGSYQVRMLAHGRQFDDDQNMRALPGRAQAGLPAYVVFEASASRRLTSRVRLFAAARNLLDQSYAVGLLPTTEGAPRAFVGGLDVRLGR